MAEANRWRKNDETQAFLVALDISGFSRHMDEPDQLLEHRYDFFIAYATPDRQQAQSLCWLLQDDASKVFLDVQDISPGALWPSALQEALEASRTIVVLVSTHTNEAFYQKEEIVRALQLAQDKPRAHTVIPVILEQLPQGAGSMPYGMSSLQAQDATRSGGLKRVATELVAWLKKHHLNAQQPQVADAVTKAQLTPYEDFARTVRQRIHDLLQPSHMQEIREAIVRQGSGATAEEILAPDQPEALLEAMESLYRATKSCLPLLRQQSLRGQKDTPQHLQEIVGWQALLIMNREQLQAQQLAFDPQQDGLRKDIPLRLEVGIEALVSSLGERAADFVLKIDNQQRARVVGRHSFQADELEYGLVHTDQLTGVLQRIWSEVMKPEPPPTGFGPDEIGRLQARLKTNERRARSSYYIAVPPDSAHALLVDRVLLARLHQTLPALRLMYLIGPGQAGILLIDEYLFNEAIETFLRLLEEKESATGGTL